MQGKPMENGAKRTFGWGWKRGGEARPGGVRDGRIFRFAEAGTDSAVGRLSSSVYPLNTAEPGKGLAVLSPQSGTRPAPFLKARSKRQRNRNRMMLAREAELRQEQKHIC